MPRQTRHASGLVLAERGYRSVGVGPVVWLSARDRRSSRGLAGGWSGYFALEGAPDAVFDITEWLDRDRRPPIVRYAYQVRYCNGVQGGAVWQYRLDLHPLEDPAIFVPHHHDEEVREDEHDPRPWDHHVTLAQALALLEQRLFARIGACGDRTPGLRGRAPYEPPRSTRVIEPS